MVCKGKIGGFIFLCSNCGALDCENCAQALTQTENACWVCSEAIDKSKSVKLFDKEGDIDFFHWKKNSKMW